MTSPKPKCIGCGRTDRLWFHVCGVTAPIALEWKQYSCAICWRTNQGGAILPIPMECLYANWEFIWWNTPFEEGASSSRWDTELT